MAEKKKCEAKEGYLMMYTDSDEVHLDLITKDHYDRIEADEVAFGEEEPLYRWFTQTHCIEPWPYDGVKILGTICVVRC